jgi:hypothetical protein
MTDNKVIEKQSSDCFKLGLCPYSEDILNKMEIDCEELCENCKFCPVTCGNWKDIVTTPDASGEYHSDCGAFQPNEIKDYAEFRDALFWSMYPYDDNLTSKSPLDVLINVGLTCGFKFDGKLKKKEN